VPHLTEHSYASGQGRGSRVSSRRRRPRTGVNRVDIVELDAAGEVSVGVCIATDRANTLVGAADRSPLPSARGAPPGRLICNVRNPRGSNLNARPSPRP